MRTSTISILATALLATAVRAQDDADGLRWRLAAGDVLVYDHVVHQSAVVRTGGTTTRESLRIEAAEAIEITRVTVDGEFVARRSVTRLRILVDGEEAWDGGGGPGEDLVFDARGGVRERGSSTRGLRRTLSGTEPEGIEAALDRVPLALQQLPLPERAADETWTAAEAPEGLSCTTQLKVERRERSLWTIRGDSVVRLTVSGETLKRGDGRIRAVFDAASGAMRECESDVTLVFENPGAVETTVEIRAVARLTSREKRR